MQGTREGMQIQPKHPVRSRQSVATAFNRRQAAWKKWAAYNRVPYLPSALLCPCRCHGRLTRGEHLDLARLWR